MPVSLRSLPHSLKRHANNMYVHSTHLYLRMILHRLYKALLRHNVIGIHFYRQCDMLHKTMLWTQSIIMLCCNESHLRGPLSKYQLHSRKSDKKTWLSGQHSLDGSYQLCRGCVQCLCPKDFACNQMAVLVSMLLVIIFHSEIYSVMTISPKCTGLTVENWLWKVECEKWWNFFLPGRCHTVNTYFVEFARTVDIRN